MTLQVILEKIRLNSPVTGFYSHECVYVLLASIFVVSGDWSPNETSLHFTNSLARVAFFMEKSAAVSAPKSPLKWVALVPDL